MSPLSHIYRRDESLACLQKDTGSLASVLVYTLRKAMTDICSQPANCKTPYGTYTPVKGKYYLLLLSFTVTIPFA